MNKLYIHILTGLFLITTLTACDNFLDIVPKGQVIPEETEEYKALLTRGYNVFPRNKELLQMRGVQITPNIDPYGLSGFPAFRNIYTWQDNADTQGHTEEYTYASFYTVIFHANSIIMDISEASAAGDPERAQLLGEAHLLRAYSYFELVNMYGPKYSEAERDTKVVPINNTIDIEQTLARATLGELYDAIESDLATAEKLMTVTQWEAPKDKFRASKEAVYAIASRVYLYKGDWAKSLSYSQKVLGVSTEMEDLNAAEPQLPTNYKSAENIWAMEDLFTFNVREYAFADQTYYDSFDDNDLRKQYYFSSLLDMNTWEEHPAQGKFNGKDFRASARRSEIYLNAAEAAARMGKDTEAKQYVATLMSKRYNTDGFQSRQEALQPLSGEALVTFILDERQKELGIEGHEWYDYKRTTQPALTKVVEDKEYRLEQGDARYVLRIPTSAISNNPQLTK
ncbi:MAG: RagB/SusD family nutrient uptake outer membrane protein [Porphyromonas sp.]|nr:RagB/SusD family nutrient uptake outer membrane protein [Porphyromonas sp.]